MPQQALALALILVAVASRWLPHPPNFSPLLAIALFAGARFPSRAAAIAVPLLGLAISNVLLGTTIMTLLQAILIALLALGGRNLGSASWDRLAGTGLAAAVAFFLASNFLVWLAGDLYPRTWQGLVDCYSMAVPFFNASAVATVLYLVTLETLHRTSTGWMGRTVFFAQS